ncbi:hypothetical protein HPB48_004838 [Haemaphysalis longicornis]|uniref:Uncharacterized protein n=1 Tax=Haemaphysalis longicornis TaxID=44386 RepID=A0A9J6GBK2_HAELO|nr:hypothetical protein HPB48_004838 [Haemaphysalis longicornis]
MRENSCRQGKMISEKPEVPWGRNNKRDMFCNAPAERSVTISFAESARRLGFLAPSLRPPPAADPCNFGNDATWKTSAHVASAVVVKTVLLPLQHDRNTSPLYVALTGETRDAATDSTPLFHTLGLSARFVVQRFLNSSLPLLNGQKMPYEFIKVECFNGGTLFYGNYHAFVHPKPSYQRRFNESFKPENPGYQYSVLIVGVDGVSRLNAHRQFPETVRFLKERMGAVEMHGYTKVGDNTFPNLVPLLTGLTEQELAFGIWSENDFLDSLPIIWKSFAANGWSTFYAEDNPELSTFNFIEARLSGAAD